MTADALFDSVIGLMFSAQEDKADYEALYYPILNLILGECFQKNNALRLRKGKEPLEEIPMISAKGEEIPYESELLRGALAYGIAANLYAEDDENGITNVYREKYAELLGEISYADFAEAEEA